LASQNFFLAIVAGLGAAREAAVAYDVMELHRRPLDKALNQIDIVFVRKQSSLLPINGISRAEGERA
jgi:hypothetical protein